MLDAPAHRILPPRLYEFLISRYHGLRAAARLDAGRGHVLPDFVIIGAAKSGTTSLYEWLCEHPYVAPARWKEVHYFDYNYFRRDDWYRKHFPLQTDCAEFAAHHGRPFLTGEASPSYLSHEWAPTRLQALLPNARLIVALRNPVDRAYSHFQTSRRRGNEPLASFADALAAEDQRLAPELARAEKDRRFGFSATIASWSYLLRGRYAEHLERWLRVFPREQFHFVAVEELSTHPQHAMNAVHEFLELPDHDYGPLAPENIAHYEPMPAEARASLVEYFRPHNQRLYELIGIDFGWDS